MKILDIKNKELCIRIVPGTPAIDHDLKIKIQKNWAHAQNEKPFLYDGDVYSLVDVIDEDNLMVLNVIRTSFSHYLYSTNNNDLNGKSICCSVAVGTALKTADGYYVLGKTSAYTEEAGVIQFVGGCIDASDIDHQLIDPYKTAKRELCEELGSLIADHTNHFIPRLLVIFSNKAGILFEAECSLTHTVVKEYFYRYQSTGLNNELRDVISVRSTEPEKDNVCLPDIISHLLSRINCS